MDGRDKLDNELYRNAKLRLLKGHLFENERASHKLGQNS